jgi:predicted CoA-binding protein
MSSSSAGTHDHLRHPVARTREERPIPDRITRILLEFKTLTVVGLSPNPSRPSHGVAAYMRMHGYRVIAVNPHTKSVFHERCYPSLADVPGDVDVVVIFRKPEDVPAVVEEAIRKRARVIWMQEGVRSDEAARRAKKAGLEVIEDHCILKEHAKRFITEGI